LQLVVLSLFPSFTRYVYSSTLLHHKVIRETAFHIDFLH